MTALLFLHRALEMQRIYTALFQVITVLSNFEVHFFRLTACVRLFTSIQRLSQHKIYLDKLDRISLHFQDCICDSCFCLLSSLILRNGQARASLCMLLMV